MEKSSSTPAFLLACLIALLFMGMFWPSKPMDPPSAPKYNGIVRLQNNGDFFCTAFVVSPRYAITAAHCVQSGGLFAPPKLADFVDVANAQGDRILTAEVVGANSRIDFALLRGDFSSFSALKVDFEGTRTFSSTKLLACGYPLNAAQIRCAKLRYQGTKFFQIRAEGELLFPGHSGGPVFDAETGLVIGVNSAVDNGGSVFAPLNAFLGQFGLDREGL